MNHSYYVSCFVVRLGADGHEFLQLLRAPDQFMGGTWQLVTGAIEPEETAPKAALRELREETTLSPREFFQLDVINTFYLARFDSIVQSPMFCAIVDPAAKVKVDDDHTDFRWTPRGELVDYLMWPGERIAFEELCREILNDGRAKPYLRIDEATWR